MEDSEWGDEENLPRSLGPIKVQSQWVDLRWLKITNIIRNSYEGLTCRVVYSGQLTDAFLVQTGVWQGCLLSPFLFLLAIDWVMKTSTEEKRNGIQWILWNRRPRLCGRLGPSLPHPAADAGKDQHHGRKLHSPWPQHPQMEEQGPEGQHYQHIPHHAVKGTAREGGRLHIPWRHRK